MEAYNPTKVHENRTNEGSHLAASIELAKGRLK